MDKVKTAFMESVDSATTESVFTRVPRIFNAFQKTMIDSLRHPAIEKLKRDEKFDLIAFGWFMNDFQIGLAAHFQCPSILISGTPAIHHLKKYVGNPSGVSHTAFHLLPVKGEMTFIQRFKNMLFLVAQIVFTYIADYFLFEPTYTEIFPPAKYPTFSETKLNVSLVLVTSHFSQSHPSANFPSLIEVSGMHIKKNPNPLPIKIKQWLDTATDGAIFFSLGSNINSADLSLEKREIILRVFARLQQKILWKWEDDTLPNQPENVMIDKWLPQDDVLAHPNVKLFISHCGKGSVNEAKYHGVPILGIPFSADQPANLRTIVDEGWAVALDFEQFTEDSFAKGLHEILNNENYRRLVKTAADLYKDRPEHPLDTAIYWVEYVLRHNGAKHMQSQAVHLNFWQYNSLDVIGFIFTIFFIVWKLFLFIFKSLIRKCCNKTRKIKSE